ncbi:MAG: GNAT family N-acetyltransferase [Candidatus Altiarchaeota archaeon]
MESVRVRDFNADDAASLVRLHRRNGRWFEDGFMSEDFIHITASRPDFRFFVADSDGEVVGFAGVLFFEGVGRAEFGPIVVDKRLRRRGLGTKLLNRGIRLLKAAGVHRVIVRVKSFNREAIMFFEENEFRKEVVLEGYTRNGESAVQLVRFI